MSDGCGIVNCSIEQIRQQCNLAPSIFQLTMRTLEHDGVIAMRDSEIHVLESKCWAQDGKTKKNTRALDVTHKANRTVGIDERIELFAKELDAEIEKWKAAHDGKIFSDNEKEKFFYYWTEHGDKDRTFRKETQKKWGWQRRLSTWHSMSEDSNKSKYAEELKEKNKVIIEQMQEDYIKQRNEEAALAKGGYKQYILELKKAYDGDEAMRKKYPGWQQSYLQHCRNTT